MRQRTKPTQARLTSLAAGRTSAGTSPRLCCAPLFLDTETTGLDADAESIEIAIIDAAGFVQLENFVKPCVPIPAAATSVNGINDQDVADTSARQSLASENPLPRPLDFHLRGDTGSLCKTRRYDHLRRYSS